MPLEAVFERRRLQLLVARRFCQKVKLVEDDSCLGLLQTHNQLLELRQRVLDLLLNSDKMLGGWSVMIQ